MTFWILAAVLTSAALLAVLLPYLRADAGVEKTDSHDLEVYADQLAEVDRDVARGILGAADGEEARAEISRRILKAAKEAQLPASSSRMSAGLAMAAILAVPLVAWGGYGLIGSPDMPAQPLAARLQKDPAQASVDELVARAEAHLAANPADGKGWDVLAPIYMRVGKSAEAVAAYAKAIELVGANGSREAGLGEAIAARDGGLISADSLAAFERALALEPANPKAAFFIAVSKAQNGRMDEAVAGLKALSASQPADSPWKITAEEALRQASAAPAEPAAPGPAAADIEAAQSMTPEDRTAMIETMVARLDEKLRASPGDVEGWKRLIRSYGILNKPDAARDALKRAMAVLGAEQAAEIEKFAKEAGLAGTN
ncbi:MAG: c-type cytochrome biogenesis protein CcmI [Rhizobiaceae bacterium]